MKEKDAWANFVNSGSVTDYLKYTSAKKEQNDLLEERHESQYGRTCYQGTEHKGTGQGNNGSYKK